MKPAHETAAKREATERQLDGAATGSAHKLGERLRASFEDLQRLTPQPKPAEGLHGRHVNDETLALKPIYDRLYAIEHQTKSRGFRGWVLAICIGVAATLAWQSYGNAAKRMIATRAPELGWSPEAKQMIAGWMDELGWTSPPPGAETAALPAPAVPAPQAAVVVDTVASNTPAAPSIDPEKVEQMARDLATLRQTVEQLTAGQDQVTREIFKLQVADEEILAKITPAPPPPRPIAALARKPTPKAPPSPPAPVAPPTSLAPIPPPDQ
jgi:hypothetical protein